MASVRTMYSSSSNSRESVREKKMEEGWVRLLSLLRALNLLFFLSLSACVGEKERSGGLSVSAFLRGATHTHFVDRKVSFSFTDTLTQELINHAFYTSQHRSCNHSCGTELGIRTFGSTSRARYVSLNVFENERRENNKQLQTHRMYVFRLEGNAVRCNSRGYFCYLQNLI